MFFVGHARYPQAVAARNQFDSLALTVEVDSQYFVIIRADCTVATDHTKDFITSLLIGRSLLQGPEPVLEEMRTRYYAVAQAAIMAATKDLFQKFTSWQEQMGAAGQCRSGKDDSAEAVQRSEP